MSFLSKAAIDAANKAGREQSEYGPSVPELPFGVHNMKLAGVKAETTKNGFLQVVIELQEPSNNYKPLVERFIIASKDPNAERPEWMDNRLARLASFFVSGFDYEIQEKPTFETFVGQLTAFVGRLVQVCVQHKEEIWEKSAEEWYLLRKATLWYAGGVDKDKLTFKVADAIYPLKDSDLIRWRAFPGKKHGSSIKDPDTTANTTTPTTTHVSQPVNAALAPVADADVEAGDPFAS